MNEEEQKNENTPAVTPVSEEAVVVAEESSSTESNRAAAVAISDSEISSEAAVPTVNEMTEKDVLEAVPLLAAPSLGTKIKNCLVSRRYTIGAVFLVLIILLALVYVMERQGRLQTGVFAGVEKMMSMHKTVARVNDGAISEYDLNISVSQITTGAEAQGADIASEEVKAQIQKQAIDMLVNTELLKQEAAKRDIVTTEAQVDERLESLKTEVGGEEVLAERMAQFNIDQKTLRRDINNELTIQALLEVIFAEKKVEITDAEVKAFYDAAGAQAEDLPPLAEVAEQIKNQIRSTKEQEIVTAYIEELRAAASIEVLI